MTANAHQSLRHSLEESTSGGQASSKNSEPVTRTSPTHQGNQSQPSAGTFFDEDSQSQHSSVKPKSRHKPRSSSQKLSNELHFRSHVTRDSMVVNLLSSFNQIPDGQGPYPEPKEFRSSFETRPLHSDIPTPVTESESAHFRDFSSSAIQPVNSAAERPYDPYENRTSPIREGDIAPKMRQSVDRGDEQPPDSSGRARTNTASSRPSTAKSAKTDKKKKKSKGSNKSVDHGDSATTKPNQTDTHAQGRSSASFDLNPADRSRRRSRTNPGSASILNRARPVPVEYHDFDTRGRPVAPPTTQYGSLPRHLTRPTISDRESSASALHENPKNKSASRSKVADLIGPDMPSLDNRSNLSATQNSSRKPSMQTLNTPPSASPTPASTNSTKYNSSTTDSPKGKPSFFRRVFGPSPKATTPSKPEDFPYLLPPIQKDEALESKRSRSALSTNSEAVDPSTRKDSARATPAPPEAPQEQPHVIQKKASFFRRKKRTASVSQEPGEAKTEPKPVENSDNRPSVSSLREVMNPFLSEAPAIVSPVETTYYESREHQSIDGEENIYIHSNASRIENRTSRAVSNVPDAIRTGSTSSQTTANWRSTSRPSETKESSRRGLSPAVQGHKSFLYDSSGAQTPAERSVAHLENFNQAEADQERAAMPSEANASAPFHKTGASGSTAADSPLAVNEPSVIVPSTVRLIPSDDTEEEWVVKTSKKSSTVEDSPPRKRLWLHPSVSESEPSLSARESRMGSVSSAPTQDLQPPSSPPFSPVDGASRSTSVTADSTIDASNPTQDDVVRAKQLFDGYNDVVTQRNATVLLGQASTASDRVRQAYMALFDFAGLNILLALRDLCGRLALKGETQQVDRILSAFAQRWMDCNPNNGFKNQDVVHTICYSLLLLNTDLHIADLDQKMTRSQFVRNTLETIRQAAYDESFHQTSTLRADHATKRGSIPWRDTRSPSPASLRRPSADLRTPDTSRLSLRPPPRPVSEAPSASSPGPYEARVTDSADLLINIPFEGTVRAWEAQVETVLKELYLSIRQQRLPLHGASDVHLHDQASNSSLGVGSPAVRRPSVLSKAPSEAARRGSDFHSWNIRNRSRQRMYQTSTHGSSRTSFDEGSVFSPNASSTWSRSFSKAPTSMSSDSIASHFTSADYGFQQSIGFANALSHAIIREEDGIPANSEEEGGTMNLLDDETLELEGAPWAKEGIVQHKHHMETTERKAKDRNWNQCFAVVEKGCIRLFSFNSKASIRSQKNRSLRGGGVVGGGNWMDSAEAVGTFALRQTLANTLPAPGYSKSRPHVFALVFPTGAVHLFHVGTPEIAKEFVSTANYWSARLSKEPLVGGVSNVEYGWSSNVINTALLPGPENSSSENSHPPSAAAAAKRLHSPTPSTSSISARPSFQGSLRGGSIDLPGRARLPGDRAALSEWVPPQQSLSRSELKEKEQLEGLKRYVKDVEEELRQHNELRPALLLTFSPRHPNASKAMSNWERKSSYLLREIVKFRTYIDSLISAQSERERVYRERAERLTPAAEIDDPVLKEEPVTISVS